MKAGSKIFSVAVLLCCTLCGVFECVSGESFTNIGNVAIFSVLSIFGGYQHVEAFPPMFAKRMGSPTPQIGGPMTSFEDEESEEDEDDLLESAPRVEPQITTMNRDQCLAKLLCGMSVPVTGGNSKRSYYNEYAQIVSKFFDAFPPDEEYQSKESIETYDDYSNEDEKPIRVNSRRKPLNSSKVEATAPTPHLFDLALVDIAKPEDNPGNTTRRESIEKVPTGNRIARARRIVENLGQKLQTVRQCQSINGCPFTFKQLREKLKRKDAQRVASNVPLPTPVWPPSPPNRRNPAYESFAQRPKKQNRPIPPSAKPEPMSVEPLFSGEEPAFPYKDVNKGDDELEEIFGPASVSKKKPLGFHQGVDESYNYDYNPNKPWRPGSPGGNVYGYRPWKGKPKPFGGNGNPNGQRRPPAQRPGPNQKRPAPPRPAATRPQNQPQRKKVPAVSKPIPKKPTPPPTTTTTTKRPSLFPKKKISYLSSPYSKPSGSQDDDEDSEDINKVAPVEFVGFDDGSPTTRRTTTEQPDEVTEASSSSSSKKKKKDNDDDDDSEEYDDDDYYNDDEDDDEDDLQDDDDVEDDDNYSAEDDKEGSSKKKRKPAKEKRRKNKNKNKKPSGEDKDGGKKKKSPSKTKGSGGTDSYIDDENEGGSESWTKLNYATTGMNFKAPEKINKGNDKESASDIAKVVASEEEADDDEDDDDDDDDDEEEDEDDARKGSLATMNVHKIRASSTSNSMSNEDDDEVDDENASKHKKHRTEEKVTSKREKEEKAPKPEDEVTEKTKKSKKKKQKAGSKKSSSDDDEDSQSSRKNFLLEIGGRPLVPKPDTDQTNAQKTTGLVSNRFKFQLINPYGGGAPPMQPHTLDVKPHTNFNSMPPPDYSDGPPPPSSGSALPFKFKFNPGALVSLTGSGGGSSGGNGGHQGGHQGPPPPRADHSMEFDGNSHHQSPHHLRSPFGSPQQHHSQQSSGLSSLSGGSGSSFFKLNPIPALTSLFKRPSSSTFDSMQNGGSGPQGPGMNAYIHRPVGPESSNYRRERPSPSNGSSKPKKYKAKGKGKKGSTVLG